jgi:hypothetical protein
LPRGNRALRLGIGLERWQTRNLGIYRKLSLASASKKSYRKMALFCGFVFKAKISIHKNLFAAYTKTRAKEKRSAAKAAKIQKFSQ